MYTLYIPGSWCLRQLPCSSSQWTQGDLLHRTRSQTPWQRWSYGCSSSSGTCHWTHYHSERRWRIATWSSQYFIFRCLELVDVLELFSFIAYIVPKHLQGCWLHRQTQYFITLTMSPKWFILRVKPRMWTFWLWASTYLRFACHMTCLSSSSLWDW